MILIITHKEDFTADFVIDKLNNKGFPYYRLNCEDLNKVNYNFGTENELNFIIQNYEKITSVWFRRTKLPDLKINDESEKLYVLGEYNALLENIYAVLRDKIWVSHPRYVYEAENKLYQIKLASEIGFNVPETLVTNQHADLRNFYSKHNCNIIIKPLHQGRIKYGQKVKTIFTNKLKASIIDDLDNFDLTPSIYQENIEKDYEIRVTTVGGKLFAGQVNSQENEDTKIDWRKSKIPFTSCTLPKEISEKCLLLTKKLKLNFGAIDMIRKPSGDYVFLEINPNGQWVWIETEIGLKISDEIINLLIDRNVYSEIL
ncbi:MAG: MvdC/MvdD family ATP grasp protein [Bacteroidota bacterium]